MEGNKVSKVLNKIKSLLRGRHFVESIDIEIPLENVLHRWSLIFLVTEDVVVYSLGTQ